MCFTEVLKPHVRLSPLVDIVRVLVLHVPRVFRKGPPHALSRSLRKTQHGGEHFVDAEVLVYAVLNDVGEVVVTTEYLARHSAEGTQNVTTKD